MEMLKKKITSLTLQVREREERIIELETMESKRYNYRPKIYIFSKQAFCTNYVKTNINLVHMYCAVVDKIFYLS